jgi:hypothetical protein
LPHLARHFIKLLPILAVTAVAACALGAPSDALAGNNGQQIKLCPNLTVSNGFAYVLGPNQNGVTTVSPVFALGEASNDIRYQTGCRTIYGYWWAGTVSVYWYRSDGRLYTKASCVVPRWNPFTDSKTCDPSGA